MSRFELKLDNFLGPIDLLLAMIEDRKLPINQVSISKVADEYINFVGKNKEEIEERTYFLSIVSTLILIKSKSLLPDLELEEGEEKDILDLEARLALLKMFQDAGLNIEKRFAGNRSLYFPRARKVAPSFNPRGINQNNLLGAMSELFATTVQSVKFATRKITNVVKLEDVIENLRTRIISAMENSFLGFVKNSSEKIENREERKSYAVVSFLALLELVKSGMIAVRQDGYSDDIRIETEKA